MSNDVNKNPSSLWSYIISCKTDRGTVSFEDLSIIFRFLIICY